MKHTKRILCLSELQCRHVCSFPWLFFPPTANGAWLTVEKSCEPGRLFVVHSASRYASLLECLPAKGCDSVLELCGTSLWTVREFHRQRFGGGMSRASWVQAKANVTIFFKGLWKYYETGSWKLCGVWGSVTWLTFHSDTAFWSVEMVQWHSTLAKCVWAVSSFRMPQPVPCPCIFSSCLELNPLRI